VKCTRFFFFFFLALLLLCRGQDVLFERMYSTNQGLILYFLEELQLQFFLLWKWMCIGPSVFLSGQANYRTGILIFEQMFGLSSQKNSSNSAVLFCSFME